MPYANRLQTGQEVVGGLQPFAAICTRLHQKIHSDLFVRHQTRHHRARQARTAVTPKMTNLISAFFHPPRSPAFGQLWTPIETY
ncbi:MAG: hypothetical protein C5B50_21450 [Verrucomicrobia bacterium]|nr:MAG: hypothetical protein C5B50_21450 [Verrucomicrobiota bacterium]